MSKIQITELQAPQSELNVLDDCQTNEVVGGYGLWGGVNVANIVQIQNNVAVQVAIGGDNINFANLNQNAGATQS
jgi:hypothetical protein